MAFWISPAPGEALLLLFDDEYEHLIAHDVSTCGL